MKSNDIPTAAYVQKPCSAGSGERAPRPKAMAFVREDSKIVEPQVESAKPMRSAVALFSASASVDGALALARSLEAVDSYARTMMSASSTPTPRRTKIAS